jgi:hypothetical protein
MLSLTLGAMVGGILITYALLVGLAAYISLKDNKGAKEKGIFETHSMCVVLSILQSMTTMFIPVLVYDGWILRICSIGLIIGAILIVINKPITVKIGGSIAIVSSIVSIIPIAFVVGRPVLIEMKVFLASTALLSWSGITAGILCFIPKVKLKRKAPVAQAASVPQN